jgi:hypothetical protein
LSLEGIREYIGPLGKPPHKINGMLLCQQREVCLLLLIYRDIRFTYDGAESSM